MKDKHPICKECKKDCKQSYSTWIRDIPPTEYCEEFIEKSGHNGKEHH
jgi:hypothetical protein